MRMRLSLTKEPEIRFVSHLDLGRALERALRRAKLPIAYSEGFNPHMRLSMGPALPLGQESRHELFDLDLTDAMTPELQDAVNSRLPAGVRVLAFQDLSKGARSLGQSATEAVYTFVLPNASNIVAVAGGQNHSFHFEPQMNTDGHG